MLGDPIGRLRVGPGRCVGVDLALRLLELHLLRENRRQAFRGRRDQGGVEGAGDVEPTGVQAGVLQTGHGLVHGLLGPRDHGLSGRVQVGDPDVAHPAQRLVHRCRVGGHRRHGAEAPFRLFFDDASPHLGHAQERLGVEDTGSVESRVLAVAVSRRDVG